jgi:hypothetical protein
MLLTASLAVVRDSLSEITAWTNGIEFTVPPNSPQPVLNFWEEMSDLIAIVKSGICDHIPVVEKLLTDGFAILGPADNDIWTQEIAPLLDHLRNWLNDVYPRILVLPSQLKWFICPAQRTNICHIQRLTQACSVDFGRAIVALDLLITEQDMNCLEFNSAFAPCP